MTDQSADDVALQANGETRINRDWARLIGLLVVCVGLVGTSLWALTTEPSGYYGHRFHGLSYFLLPASFFFFFFALYRCFVPWGPPVRISREGFADFRAGNVWIPWSEISNVVRKGEYVSLTLRRKYARSYPFSLSQKALKASRKSAGPTHVLIAAWCLKTDSHRLLDTIKAYRNGN